MTPVTLRTSPSGPAYLINTTSPEYTETAIYVNGQTGSDTNTGISPEQSLQSVDEAVRRVSANSTPVRIIILGKSHLPGGYSMLEMSTPRSWDAPITFDGSQAFDLAGFANQSVVSSDATDGSITIDPAGISSDDDYVSYFIEILSSSESSIVGLRRQITASDASTGKIYLSYFFDVAPPAGTVFQFVKEGILFNTDSAALNSNSRARWYGPPSNASQSPANAMSLIGLEYRSESGNTEIEFSGNILYYAVRHSTANKNLYITNSTGRAGRIAGAFPLNFTNDLLGGWGISTGTLSGPVWIPGTNGEFSGGTVLTRSDYSWMNIISGQLSNDYSFIILRGCRLKGWEFPATTGSLFGKQHGTTWIGQLFAGSSFGSISIIDGPSTTAQVSIEYDSQLDIVGRVDSLRGTGRWILGRYSGSGCNLRAPLTILGNAEVLGGSKCRMQGNQRPGIAGDFLVGYNETLDADDFSAIGDSYLSLKDGSSAQRTS